MPKITAIVLIGLFALSQYAKQLSYLECKLSNSFKAETEQCDCETKLTENNTRVPDTPVNSSRFHVHIDDVYLIEKKAIAALLPFAPAILNSRYSHSESNGNTQPLLQPPRS